MTRRGTTPIPSRSSMTSSATSARSMGPTRARASHRPARPTSNISWPPVRPTIPACVQPTVRPGPGSPRDLRNLTLASPQVNRYEKSGKDAAEWVPDRNRCWFAGRVLEVRRAYGLTVDRREAAALESILSSCDSVALEPIVWRGSRQRRRSGVRVRGR